MFIGVKNNLNSCIDKPATEMSRRDPATRAEEQRQRVLQTTRDILQHLEVKESTIKNAGLGVFLKQGAPDFPPGTPMMRYYGHLVKGGEQEFSPYLLQYGGDYLDPEKDGKIMVPKNKLYPANPGPRVNDAKDDRNKLRYEEPLFDEEGLPFVVMNLKRKARPGEELFCPYGKPYWDNWSAARS